MKYKLVLLIGLVTSCITSKHVNDLKDTSCVDKLSKVRVDVETGVRRAINGCSAINSDRGVEDCRVREIERAFNAVSLLNNAYYKYTETVVYEDQYCDELVGILSEIANSYLK